MRFIFIIAASMLLSAPLAAQQKYSAWSNPDGGGASTRELVDRLNALIDEAEKSRAADPVFLRDLRDLTRGYGAPAGLAATVLSDDFADGDFSTDPVWTVDGGRFWIEKDWGLRSAVSAVAEQQSGKAGDKDLAIALFGAILKQATKGKGEESASAPAETQTATIRSAAAIANAFIIEFEFSSWQPEGRFDIGPYQGTDAASGYRLSYAPGGELALLRVSPRGTGTVRQVTIKAALEDNKPHVVIWARDAQGRMEISIDGKSVMSATDRGFSDPFQGIVMINRGGDYIIKRIAVR